jgi:hypothetical protein
MLNSIASNFVAIGIYGGLLAIFDIKPNILAGILLVSYGVILYLCAIIRNREK